MKSNSIIQAKELSLPAAVDYVNKISARGDEHCIKDLAKVIHTTRHESGTTELLAELRAEGATKIVRAVARKLEKAAPEISEIQTILSKLATNRNEFLHVALKFAELMVSTGSLSAARINQETKHFLSEIAKKLLELREDIHCESKEERLQILVKLRKIDRELLDFTSNNSFIKAADYVAINAQHATVSLAIKRIERGVLEAIGSKNLSNLEKTGFFIAEEIRGMSQKFYSILEDLHKSGLVHLDTIPGVGKIFVYPSADVDPSSFERIIPARMRERIGELLSKEFNTKYSGKLRPIGISENREGGVPTLLDRKRVGEVAKEAGVSISIVVLALKYLEKHGLVGVEHTGYVPTQLGKSAGLGFRSVRFVQRRHALGVEEKYPVSLEAYLQATLAEKEKWKVPGYSYISKDGGAPWVYLLDEILVGNARVDSELLPRLLSEICSQQECLVIASNLIQGDPAVLPKAMRTSINPNRLNGVDLREYGEQIRFAHHLMKMINQPILQLHGRKELETADILADTQRIRDLEALNGLDRSDEKKVKASLSRLNEIEARSGRKFNAKLHTELLEFISNVTMPLEMKLGRELLDSTFIKERLGLNMNELEIVRDMVSLLLNDVKDGGSTGKNKVLSLYGEFLSLPEAGPEYIEKLIEALVPNREKLEAGSIVSRGGAKVTFITPDGASGLSMLCLPEARFGIGEVMNPTAKLMSVVKSNILAGTKMPDIICVASTGQPVVSMTAGGQLIVSADTLQASSFESSFLYTEGADTHKRRRWGRGGENSAGCIAFSGGIDQGIKTDAYTIRLWSQKIREVLDHNASLKRPLCERSIYATSDWQTGSPTAKPSTWLRGLFWAIGSGQKEIVLNGDLIQGQNYGRASAESQLTGLIGIEDQQAFIHALLNPVLDLIKELRDADPTWELPRFTILVGNHETNSQSGKGAQGTWFLQTVAAQIESYYRGAFGARIADEKVLYPKKFVDRLGVDVDYSHVVLDFSDTTGFRIAAQHYVGVGAKGSSSVPPVSAAAKWGRSMENELRPIHGFLLGHWHTQSITQSDGVFYAIFGANADKSGFEWHLGYPTTVPASGLVKLSSVKPPELMFVTDPYLRLQERSLLRLRTYRELVQQFGGSLEEFVEYERSRHQKRNQKGFSYKELHENGRHAFIDPHRRIDDAA